MPATEKTQSIEESFKNSTNGHRLSAIAIEVSVIIVNWNVKERLVRCLESIRALTSSIPYEVIVVDNASSDDSVAMLREHFPKVRLIANDRNLGFSQAVNQGIKIAKGSGILLLNPDTVLENDAIGALNRFLHDHPEVGAVTGKIMNPDGSYFRAIRGRPNPFRWYLVSSVLQHLTLRIPAIRDWLLLSESEYERSMQIDDVHGALFMTRRSILHKIGLLDERIFLKFADADLSLRILDAGWQLAYTPQARVMHIGGASRKKQHAVSSLLRWHRARLQFYRKHFGKAGCTGLRLAGVLESLLLTAICTVLWLACLGRNQHAKNQVIAHSALLVDYSGLGRLWLRNREHV